MEPGIVAMYWLGRVAMYWLGRVVSTCLAISAIMQDHAIGRGVAARRRSQACGCIDRGFALDISVESASAATTVPMPSPGGVAHVEVGRSAVAGRLGRARLHGNV